MTLCNEPHGISPQILLIEDDKLTARVTLFYISKQFQSKTKVTHVERLEEALEQLVLYRFDTILLDLNLPDSDGLVSLEKVLSLANGTAVIVLTGSQSEKLGLEAVKLGAQDYLQKGTYEGPMLEQAIRFAMERNEMLRMLTALAVKDVLCGGFNRRGFFQTASNFISNVTTGYCFLAAFDLNNFKQVNDIHGHSAGDELLKLFAELLRKAAGNNTITARLGGDEFVALGSNIEFATANEFLTQLGNLVTETNKKSHLKAPISFSAGYVEFVGGHDNATKLDDLLNNADDALYIEKRNFHEAEDEIEYIWGCKQTDKKVEMVNATIQTSSSNHERGWNAARAILKLCRWTSEPLWRHQKIVGAIAEAMATKLGLEADKVVGIRWAGELHDIGKLGLPQGIVALPRILNTDEIKIVRKHTELGAELIRTLDSPWRELQWKAASSHHERWDGSGYPRGISGDKIPIAARIVAVADAYHAMIDSRPYREMLSSDAAIHEICEQAGKQYDPRVVDCFLQLEKEGLLPQLIHINPQDI